MNKHVSVILPLALALLLVALAKDQAQAQTAGKQLGNSAMSHYGPFDDDGDGIPNGQDPDYVRPQNGTGHQFGKMHGAAKMHGKSNGQMMGHRNQWSFGSRICDGTGPKGRGR